MSLKFMIGETLVGSHPARTSQLRLANDYLRRLLRLRALLQYWA